MPLQDILRVCSKNLVQVSVNPASTSWRWRKWIMTKWQCGTSKYVHWFTEYHLTYVIQGVELRTNVFEAFDSFDGKSVLWNELPLPRLSTRSQEEATTKKKEEFELVHQNLDGNSEQFTVVLAWWNDRENMKLIWITEKSASLRRCCTTLYSSARCFPPSCSIYQLLDCAELYKYILHCSLLTPCHDWLNPSSHHTTIQLSYLTFSAFCWSPMAFPVPPSKSGRKRSS